MTSSLLGTKFVFVLPGTGWAPDVWGHVGRARVLRRATLGIGLSEKVDKRSVHVVFEGDASHNATVLSGQIDFTFVTTFFLARRRDYEASR